MKLQRMALEVGIQLFTILVEQSEPIRTEIQLAEYKCFWAATGQFERHTPSKSMKPIDITISPETIETEIARPPEKMRYDDFIWCIGATFAFLGTSLVIEAPLLGFLGRLLEVIRETIDTGAPVQLNDEYGSFQLTVSEHSGEITIIDAFGGGSARLPRNELVSELRREFRHSTSQLECSIPQMLTNEAYQQLKDGVERGIEVVTR